MNADAVRLGRDSWARMKPVPSASEGLGCLGLWQVEWRQSRRAAKARASCAKRGSNAASG
jgi:hypothetical protein